jgi:uncharacterized BrkB/YihY/UPF0761 family membrane protein
LRISLTRPTVSAAVDCKSDAVKYECLEFETTQTPRNLKLNNLKITYDFMANTTLNHGGRTTYFSFLSMASMVFFATYLGSTVGGSSPNLVKR